MRFWSTSFLADRPGESVRLGVTEHSAEGGDCAALGYESESGGCATLEIYARGVDEGPLPPVVIYISKADVGRYRRAVAAFEAELMRKVVIPFKGKGT